MTVENKNICEKMQKDAEQLAGCSQSLLAFHNFLSL
jgi:hypothetical protein